MKHPLAAKHHTPKPTGMELKHKLLAEIRWEMTIVSALPGCSKAYMYLAKAAEEIEEQLYRQKRDA